MGIFNNQRAWRAVVIALVLGVVLGLGPIGFGPTTDAHAGSMISPGAMGLIRKSAEPFFGLSTTKLSAGGLFEKWMGVERKLADEMVQLALCDGDRERCVSPAALRLLAIVDSARAKEGRGRFGELNRAINLAIRPMSDLAQHGQVDVWSSPIETFASGAGDCEDYAIAKFAALRLAGIAPDDIRIVVLRDQMHGEDHALVLARLEGHWLSLDNRRLLMVEDVDMRNHKPLFVLDDRGVMRYDEPAAANVAERQDQTPAIPSSLITPVNLVSTSN